MRFLAAIAFLLLGVAYAHHSAEHKLRYPQFHPGLAHTYELTINMTAGVPGLSSQVSKAFIFGEVIIFAKTENELVLRFDHVEASGSLPGVSSKTQLLKYDEQGSLKEELQVPTYAKYQNGKIVEYSQNTTESLLAQKIRRTVWRNLQVYIDEKYTGSDDVKDWPITYNLTRDSPAGKYKSHYAITVSPFIDWPKSQNVYNISRFDNFEGIPYIAYKYHHNFEKQGCPEVCNKEHIENRFGSGCPTGHEPHHGLIKRSFTQHHNLKLSDRAGVPKILIFDTVYTKETHLADVYDQGLEVTVESTLKYEIANDDQTFDYNRNQLVKTDLDDLTQEVQESAWEDFCQYPDTLEKVNDAKRLLSETADVILADENQSEKSKEVGRNVVTIQKIMQRFKIGDFRALKDFIKSYHQLEAATEQEKIIRQLWLDILPTVGTDDSVTFIVTHIKENINADLRGISFWESKSVLEALPQNIHHPTKKTITDLSRLLNAKIPETTGYTLFYSAAHMAVARVIRRMCAYPLPEQDEQNLQSSQQSYSLRNMWQSQSEPLKEGSDKFRMYLECPEKAATHFIERVTDSLLKTQNKAKRVIYIETLSLTGLPEVLPTLRKYVHSNPKDRSIFPGLTVSYVDYIKTSTIFALHNLAGRSPRQVQDILVPVFFNVTLPPKVRNSAFSVLVKSQPTLALLEQIAALSWREPSEEVASYVTSTFESFGNSSLPCYQSLSQRLRKVYPQLKRHDGGIFNAKNILLDVFDELTGYGIEKRFEYIPSNESFIPNIFYSSVGYNVGNLKDYACQVAGNVQGITFRQIYDEILKRVSLTAPADISKEFEKTLFRDVTLVSRDPEPWKAIFFHKIFYSTSYYYLDANDFTTQDLYKMFLDLFTYYVKDQGSEVSGHFVKLYIPTSFHSKSIFKAVPFPTQFEMKSPLLLSLKFKLTYPTEKILDYKIDVQPSVYHSHIFVNEILNLGDCKRVGVYYEQKTAASYPFLAAINVERSGKLSFSYKVPKLPKTIVSHRSEAGTYSGKDYLTPLPTEERRTIKTRPTQFKYPVAFSYFGLPKFTGEIKTEDLPFSNDPLPQNWQEAALYVHRLYMNSGWRRRSVEIQRVPETIGEHSSDEVEYELNYWRNYKYSSKKQSEANWSQGLKFDDKLTEKDTRAYAAEGRKMHEKIKTLSHIQDNVEFKVHHRSSSTSIKESEFKLEYYHTFGGYLHLLHMNISSTSPLQMTPIVVTADYATGFINMPNEFKYEQKYEQKGMAIGAVAFCKTTPFLNPAIAFKSVFHYTPLGEVLPLEERVTFEPDTSAECKRDTRGGAAHSPACIKAIREKSIYNHLRMHTVWTKDVPYYVFELGKLVDLSMKNSYFSHIGVAKKPFSPTRDTSSLRVEATYIDKMTDEPAIDIHVDKPSEIVNYTMVPAGILKPLSSIESVYETYAHDYSNNTYPASCSMTGNYVKTYDMKVYEMAKHDCPYVLTTHCTEYKKFAVIVQRSRSEVPEVRVHLGEDKIILYPGSDSSYPVKFNSKQQALSTLQHVMLNESALISAQVFLTTEGSSYIQIHAVKAGVKVLFDGQYVKVQVNPRYKGELCGLCSEYNGEISREYRGPDRCLYLNGEGLSISSIVGRCGEKSTRVPRLCDNEEIQVHWARGHGDSEEDSREGYEPTTKRNIVTSQGNKLCFSTKPVPVCVNSAQPTMTEPRQVDFHCLPKQDMHARKMVTESKRRILGELETKTVDYSDSIEVAKMC
ncbi:vitellogenin-6 [Parasteatoda tepidariorum]|uniref:vitellogenin-6 n=1 Tax=Parasteatoda tepidariorum TaxID=114398 RepID=UPI00077FB274|nr:vitellogenin-6 [Parasteatoda tepidariorum]